MASSISSCPCCRPASVPNRWSDARSSRSIRRHSDCHCPLSGHRQGDPFVVAGGGIGSLGRAVGVAVADALALAPVGDGVHQVLGQEHHTGLVHADVHPLAPAGAVAVAQGRADGEHRAPGGQEIDEGTPRLGRLVAGIAGDPAVAVGCPLGWWPGPDRTSTARRRGRSRCWTP